MVFFWVLGPADYAYAAERVQNLSDPVVLVLDPGHGGDEAGTQGYENLDEKVMNMITAQTIREELSKYDNITVYLTHEDDRKMSLQERAEFAASVNADFLISIHYNASEGGHLYGSECWVSVQHPFNAYGYQLGMAMMSEIRSGTDLLIRGVKSKQGNDGDYYGIIRHCYKNNIPALIIEHAHVDHMADRPYIDDEEDYRAFGRMDALAIAKYFGLRSQALGVDYSSQIIDLLPAADPAVTQVLCRQDVTAPEVCTVECTSRDNENYTAEFVISGADYDGMLLYYDYSIDGGKTYTGKQVWPGADTMVGSYQDTFPMHLEFGPGAAPSIIFRAYNQYDLSVSSSPLIFEEAFPDPEAEKRAAEEAARIAAEEKAQAEAREAQAAAARAALEKEEPAEEELISYDETEGSAGLSDFFTEKEETVEQEVEKSGLSEFQRFIRLCLFILGTGILFLTPIVIYMGKKAKRKKRDQGRTRFYYEEDDED